MAMTRARAAALALALVSPIWGGGAPSRADGAFPDSLSVIVPADRQQQVALATNFGLISSNDDGASWTWVCESALTNCSNLYSVSAAPADRLFALSAGSLVYSDDDACDWSVASGAVSGGGVVDAFPLAQDAARVLAVVSPNGVVGAQTAYTVVASRDGGATFGDVIFTAASGDIVTGVEAARGDASTIYVTLATSVGFSPALAISTDAGATWRTVDLSPTLGMSGIRLIGVDRTNAGRVFLRVSSVTAESLAVFDAASGAVTLPLMFAGGLMTGFVQTAEGPLVAAGRHDNVAAVHRSLDGGATWLPIAGAPQLRSIAEHDGKLYAATDTTVDGYALARSTDLGVTWQPFMRFADVGAIAPCVRASCQATCMNEVALGLWPVSTCTAAPETKPSRGSGCEIGGQGSSMGGGALSGGLYVLALVLATSRRRGARDGRRRAPGGRVGWACGAEKRL